MKTKITLFAALILSFVMMNCSEDMDSVSIKPTFEDIEVTPSKCNPGDSVTVSVKYAKEGKYFYFYQQKVTLNDSIIVYHYSEHTTALPTVRFKAPTKPGRYTVKFTSRISYTSGTTLYDVPDDALGTLTVINPDDENE